MKHIKTIFTLTGLLVIATLSWGQTAQRYHIDNTVRINRTYCSSLSKLSVLIPCPMSNQYQTIKNVRIDEGGELLSCPDSDNKYVRFLNYSDQLQALGDKPEFTVSFDATLRPVHFDFSQVDTIYPYNTSSPEYQQFTGASNVYIVPDNPTIKSIANQIWSQSADYLDYARQCYEYVANNYEYLNPYTGLHPLSQLLADGGGDCGNLSSIYISLLRNKKIPSRHVVSILPDNDYHIWAEFYLEGYGWIPVDVTYKNSDPFGDYFGNYDGFAIVVSTGIILTLEKLPDVTYQCVLFQSYEYWYWHNNANLCSNITAKHIVHSQLQTEVDETQDQRLAVYPNPTTGIVKIKGGEFKEVKVYNTLGVMVGYLKTKGQDDTEVDLSNLPNGIYVLQASDENQHLTRQVVKMK